MVYQMNGSGGTCWVEEYGDDDGAVVAVDCNHQQEASSCKVGFDRDYP